MCLKRKAFRLNVGNLKTEYQYAAALKGFPLNKLRRTISFAKMCLPHWGKPKDRNTICPDAQLLDGLSMRGSDAGSAQTEVEEWIRNSGILE